MSKKTLALLNAQIAKLQKEAAAIQAQEVAGVVSRIKEAIAHYNLTAADLGLAGGAEKKPAKKPGRTAVAAPAAPVKKKAPAKGHVGAVKYRDDQGNHWTGHGKRPNWFKAALEAGKTAEDLLAKSEG